MGAICSLFALSRCAMLGFCVRTADVEFLDLVCMLCCTPHPDPPGLHLEPFTEYHLWLLEDTLRCRLPRA